MAGLKKTGVQLVAEDASAFNAALTSAEKAVTQFGQSATASGGKVSAASQIMTGALRSIGAMATNALADAGRAFVGFLGDSVKKAGDFEANMKVFGSVTGSALQDSGKSLKDFSDLFIQLGRDLPVSTAEVQQAAIELAKGGIDPATIAAGALRTSLNLAAAGGVGLADSATILSKQLGVWVDSAATAQEKSAFLADTADLLSQAANVTTSDVGDMAIGLANVGGVAKVAGLSFHETVQTMALLAPSFSSASDAGTSFKTFLSRLQPTTKPATAAMTELGLYTAKTGSAFYDAQGNFVGMEKASALLQTATSGLTEAQRLMAFQTIFGTDAIRAAAIIADKGAAGFDAMGVSMAGAGTVAAQAAARQVGFNTALENAKGSLEALQLTIGAALIPVLADLLNTYIAPGINTVTAWAGAILSATDPLTALVTSIDSLLPGFAAFTTFVSTNLTPILIAVGTVIATLVVPAIVAAGIAFGAAVIAGAPLVLGLVALGAAAAALYLIWQDGWTAASAEFITFATGVWTQIQTLATQFVAWITPLIPVVLTQLAAFGSAVIAWVGEQAPVLLAKLDTWGQQFIAWIGPKIPPMLAQLGQLASAAWSWIVAQAAPILAKLETWGQQFIAWIGPKIGPMLSELGSLASSAWSWIAGEAPVLLAKLDAWGQQFIAWIGPKIAPMLAELGALATSFLSWIGSQAAPILASLKAWATSFVAWIGPATVDFLSKWPGVLSQFLDWIGSAAGPLLAKLGDWAIQFVAWILPMVPGFIVALGGIAVALMAFVAETAVTLLAKLGDWGKAFGEWISTDAIPALVAAWPGFLTSLKGLMDAADTWATGKAAELGQAIVDGIINGLNTAAGALFTKLNTLASDALATLQKAFKTGSPSQLMADEIGRPIVEGMQLGILNEMPHLLAAMRTSTDSLIQEIVGFVGMEGTGPLSKAGADAINAFIAGIQQQAPRLSATAAQSGSQIVTGMYLSTLRNMPKLLAAMRQSGDAAMKELVKGFDTGDGFDILTQAGDGDRTLTQAGVDAINRFIAGMQSVDIPTATLPIHQALIGLFEPPNTKPMIDALAAVHGTVQDLGALLIGNSTGNSSIEGDTKKTFTSIVDLTHEAWEKVRTGISTAIIDARSTVDTATKAIQTISTENFTKLKTASEMAWGQIHKGITDQIQLTQAGVKLTTDTMLKGTTDTFHLLQTNTTRTFGQIHLQITDQIGMTRTQVGLTTDAMKKATTATWGLMGADAAAGWQKVKTNIETPTTAAQATVTTASTAMQESLKIPQATQDQIFETYRHVTDRIIEQLEKVTTQIDNVTEALGRLASARQAQSTDSGLPSGYTGRAAGGPMQAGVPYLVGEHRPEVVVPQTDSLVFPSIAAFLGQRISPPASGQQIRANAIYNQQQTTTFHLTAQYRSVERQSLVQDIQTLQLLYGST